MRRQISFIEAIRATYRQWKAMGVKGAFLRKKFVKLSHLNITCSLDKN
jgi:hypothetical protein